VRVAQCHRQPHSPHAHRNSRADLEEFFADRRRGGNSRGALDSAALRAAVRANSNGLREARSQALALAHPELSAAMAVMENAVPRRSGRATKLAESGAGDEVIMNIAGHVSRARLSRYSHVRMEAKRRALDEIAARQRAADEKRKAEAVRGE